MDTLTADYVRSILHYDPDSGVFTWLRSGGKAARGMPAGKTMRGYTLIGIDGKQYFASRLAWLYMTGEWPSLLVDHKDRDKGNDSWGNLRLATHSENCANYVRRGTYPRGVYRYNQKYRATCRRGGRVTHSKMFETPEEAHAEYLTMAKAAFGEFLP
jgi:hypothetical protein